MNTGLVIALMGVIIAVGKAVDTYMYNSERNKIYEYVKNHVKRIEKKRIPELSNIIIGKVLEVLRRIINLRDRPFKSLLLSIVISWVLTTAFFIYCVVVGYSETATIIVAWHDYLPWFPTYIVNFIFDFLTILTSIIVLKFIHNKSGIVKLFGIAFDLVLCFVFFVFCSIFFEKANDIFDSLLSINKKETYHNGQNGFMQFDGVNYQKDSLVSKDFPRHLIDSIEYLGFSENATIEVALYESSFISEIKYYFSLFPEIAILSLQKRPAKFDVNVLLKIRENTKNKTFVLRGESVHNRIGIIVAMTTFLPTYIYLVGILLLILFRLVIILSRNFVLRWGKSLIQNAKKDNDEIEINPGVHIGVFLSVLIGILKLIGELFS